MGNKLNEVIPSGKGRGRPEGKNPKGPYVPTGKPRGRPAPDTPRRGYVPNGMPRGRRPGQMVTKSNRGVHFRVPDHLKVAKEVYVPTGNPRGRPSEGKTTKYVKTGKPRGRAAKAKEETDE
jgi:hypothetical protein